MPPGDPRGARRRTRTILDPDGTDALLTFLLDGNLGFPAGEKPRSDPLSASGIEATSSTDLARIDAMVADHEPDIAYIPTADFHRLVNKGDRHHRGLAIATSKFTGEPTLRSLLVVCEDDPANGLDDLSGARYGYINKSCSSSYFPPALLLARRGKKLDDFLQLVPVDAWQEQTDAVVSKEVRATMVLEDVWKSTPRNEADTKIIGEHAGGKPPVVVVRESLDEATRKALLEALLAWTPPWNGVYGAFKPFYYADVHAFLHDLDGLPTDL